MTARQLRRAAERAQRKADRKAGFPNANPISEARLAANRANAKLSKGALTPETKAISAQNHTIHGLARHSNGAFKLLDNEDPQVFASLAATLVIEHEPINETEAILVQNMTESRWLSQRAQRLQNTCINSADGTVKDKEGFQLYLRYYNTHQRNFFKALQQLQKGKTDQAKRERGVEAQRLKQEAQEMEKERLEMKKTVAEIENFRKEMVALRERGKVFSQIFAASKTNPQYAEQMAAEMAERFVQKEQSQAA